MMKYYGHVLCFSFSFLLYLPGQFCPCISPPQDLPSSHHHCFALSLRSGLFLPRVIASAATEAKLHQPCWEPLDVITVALFVAAYRAHNNPHRELILSGLLWQHLLGERFC